MTNFLIKLFVKDYKDVKSKEARERYGNFGSIVGIVCNIFLCAVKIIIGSITSSIAIVADGLNNLSDMGSSVITMIGFKLSGRPADRDHPFGHGRMEYLSAFIVSGLILIVGGELLISSVKSLINGDPAPTYTVWSVAALIVSILVKLWLYLFNRNLGKKINSSALIATAKDSINDCISTSVILIAAVLTRILPALPFNLDTVMAIGVALFILWSGFSSAKETIGEILGGPPDEELVESIKNTVLSFDCFEGIHDLIVHNYGPGRQFASVHVEVPQSIDIVYCHEQVDLCEKVVCEQTDVELVIHMDPIDTDSSEVAETKEAISKIVENIDSRLTIHDFRMTPVAKQKTNLIFDVVLPSGFDMDEQTVRDLISKSAKEVNSTFVCVITIDYDFTGR
ncbi:MAG: cation diffusion facilitator family transporter [Clostridia bacterium]|nr:cation diffusion facilitator family transporter [Clostridia bacterium]